MSVAARAPSGSARVAASLVLTAVMLAGLVLAGRGRLGAPPVLHMTRFGAWLAADGTAIAMVAILRLVLLAAGVYVIAVGALALVLLHSRSVLAGRVLRAIALPGTRTLLAAVIGLSLASRTGAATISFVGQPISSQGAPVMVRLPSDPPVLVWLPPEAPAPSTTRVRVTMTRRTLRPGDSLWSVAEETLSKAWGRAPDARSLGAFWWQVVQLNRPHLPDPANPDLVFPGDVVVVPPPPQE